MDITVTITVLHTAVAQLVMSGLEIVCVHLGIEDVNACTVSVFIVIQGTFINSVHISYSFNYVVLTCSFFIEVFEVKQKSDCFSIKGLSTK